MPQLLKGETFVNGQQVQDYRLNQLVDSAQLLVGAISEQPAMTANTVEASDQTLINDGGVLKRTTFGDVLNSNLPATHSTVATSIINSANGKDVLITPNDSATVTGKLFVSADGITTTVTSVAHELTTGQILTIVATNTDYSGQFIITVTGVDTFTYVVPTKIPAVVAASGTCSYTKEGAVQMNGNARVNENFYVSGNTTTVGTLTTRGTIDVVGAANLKGQTDITGTLKVNGEVGYVLTEIYEQTPTSFAATYAGFYDSAFTSSVFTKPSNEIWIFEVYFRHQGKQGYSYDFAGRYGSQTYRTGAYIFDNKFFDSAGGGALHYGYYTARWVVPTGVEMENETFKLDVYAASGSEVSLFSTTGPYTTIITGGSLPPSKFRIYKYKTA